MPSAFEAALTLFAGGWPVLDMPPSAKFPPPDGRTGGGGVDLTADEVEALRWTGNLAVRMPPDVLGLDVDAYHGGLDTLAALIGKCGALPPTWISHSNRGDGSGILFFRVPIGMAWLSNLPGIEVIRRGHRYAMVPPSVHPDGRTYGIRDQQAKEDVDVLPPVDDLPELPWPWIGELSRASSAEADEGGPTEAASGGEVSDFVAVCTEADAPTYVSTITTYFVEHVAEGYTRHGTMQHCLIWAMECARAGITRADEAIGQLHTVWSASMRPEEERRVPLALANRVTEFEAMLRHAIGKVQAKSEAEMMRLHDDIAGIPFAVVPPSPGPTIEEPPIETPIVFTRPRVEDIPDPFVVEPVEWLVEGMLPRPTHGEFAGPEKSYKSTVSLIVDIGLALGEKVLGRFPVPKAERVLIYSGEGGRDPWLHRVAMVTHQYGAEPGDLRGRVRFSTAVQSVASLGFEETLREELETFGPALVRLDPWYAYASGSADSRQVTEVGSQLARLEHICAEGGATLSINHHFNRSEQVGLRKITGAGHAEWVDSWVLLDHLGQPSGTKPRLMMRVGSRRMGDASYEVALDIDHDLGRIEWQVTEMGEEGPDSDLDPLTEAKLALLRTGRKAHKAITKAAWVERTKGVRASTLRAAFDELLADGQIVEVGTVRSGTRTVPIFTLSEETQG